MEKITMIHESADGCRTEVTRTYRHDMEPDIWEMGTIIREFLKAQGYMDTVISKILKDEDEDEEVEAFNQDRISILEEQLQTMKQQTKDLVYELQQIFNVE